jgi:catechol 2,3-dioxygenase-like lactoylglutathione lyase family enzyme
MTRVTGIGGVFFKSQDPAKIQAWYHEHLGLEPREEAGGATLFKWRDAQDPAREQVTVWSPFPLHTDYFDPTTASYMINYIVDDLDEMLQQLRAAGVQVDDRVEESWLGRFGWAIDPEGVRFELWQPPTRFEEKEA